MGILKKVDKKKEGSKLIGGFVPRKLAVYLSMYSLAYGKTKSLILKELVTNWMYSQTDTINSLTRLIGTKAYNVWKTESFTEDFDAFLDTLKNELSVKNIAEYSDEIIKHAINEKKKDEKRNPNGADKNA